MTIIDIYTDGACKGNPGPGGWGAYLKSGDHEKDIFGGDSQTTNNRMELMAVIEALKTLKNRSRIRLFIDSQYVKNGINIWISNWKKNGWRTSNKKAVKNVDLWMQLDELVPNHEIEWIWVKGHAGNFGNERADALANQGVPQ
ncbi:ribonuclease HI [Burkholderiales bacterium]|jgi:ribonuclease HI|nr:ribonuclease HI [Betaproteobacteria bacterium]MDC3409176.1 ribonuclease HI [Burkholderiales bacterium]MBT6183312.1 ribonuclease HI [Betaproteobacteria bacterium]MBT6529703.1 ribonuclease HI [Betaproteobacteria bacterium]MBT7426384.1 ribonuclease HI [Betaproteobacteria bacterium]